jgi:hypothetical protein
MLRKDNSSTRPQVYFPKIRPHAPNTVLTPERSTLAFLGKFKQVLWVVGGRLKEPDIKYAVKVGMATAVLAAPAFMNTTRPVFTEYRGEWALISVIVISPVVHAWVFSRGNTVFRCYVANNWRSAFVYILYALVIYSLIFHRQTS